MTTSLYLRPRGLLYGSDAIAARAEGAAGALGGGAIAFLEAEVIRRDGSHVSRNVLSYLDLKAATEFDVVGALNDLTAPRPDFAAMPLSDVAVMGVVNVTPDSFSDGGSFAETETALLQARRLIGDGADIIDIGGESTRPGADAIPINEELQRVLPVIEGLADQGVPISIDTRKPEVMEAAVAAGAVLVNDVTSLSYVPHSMDTVCRLQVPAVLMHSAGDPKVMQDNPTYEDVLLDVHDALRTRIEACVSAGIDRENIIVDPGIGFGKTYSHNHALLHGLSLFHGLGVRLMLGVSRKAFIGALTGEKKASNRISGSVAAALIGVMQGVQILRVHDVRETVQAVRTWRGVLGI